MVAPSPDQVQKTFTERLKRLARRLDGYPGDRGAQGWLAQKFGLKPQAVGKWWRGEAMPKGSRMTEVAKTLKTNVAYLRGETSDEPDTLLVELQEIWPRLSPGHQAEVLGFAKGKLSGQLGPSDALHLRRAAR